MRSTWPPQTSAPERKMPRGGEKKFLISLPGGTQEQKRSRVLRILRRDVPPYKKTLQSREKVVIHRKNF